MIVIERGLDLKSPENLSLSPSLSLSLSLTRTRVDSFLPGSRVDTRKLLRERFAGDTRVKSSLHADGLSRIIQCSLAAYRAALLNTRRD